MKKILILLFIFISYISYSQSQLGNADSLTPFYWQPISDEDKIMQYENQKNLTKRSVQQAGLAADLYVEGVALMKNKEYNAAVTKFEAAMKRYKRAKLSTDAMNFIHTNMALSYTKSGNKKDIIQAERLLNLITPKLYNDNNWTYNAAIAYYLIGKGDQAASLLSSLIRKDKFYFQAYITLEAIYRESGNEESADKVIERMNTAEEKFYKKSNNNNNNNNNETNLTNNDLKPENGKKPDITNLNPVDNDKLSDFTLSDKKDQKSITKLQEGISDYELGIKSLKNDEYAVAQKYLKDAEKTLKRLINEDGLNFTRGNLVISYLATEEKRGVGQANRYLKNLTSKLFKTRKWTYNMAVSYYQFAFMSARKNKKDNTRKWGSPKAAYNLETSIKLFQKVINQDKLYLPAYENLIYIYREQGENQKADKLARNIKKARLKLMTSYSKQKQINKGGDIYIFRINLGTFGMFDTPAYILDEPNVIAIPISEKRTAYLSGLFYNLDDAEEYQKKMEEKGYERTFIVAYNNGEELEF